MVDRVWLRSRINHRLAFPASRALRPRGIDMATRDWDVLVVLDACRFDVFDEVVFPSLGLWVDGYDVVTSPGSATPEWTRKTWDRSFPATRIVSGNPVVAANVPGLVYDYVSAEGVMGTLDAAREHDEPDKRLVVVVPTPHYPFVEDPTPDDADSPWKAVRRGDVALDSVIDAYRRTLANDWPAIEAFVEEVDGRVVVTADHGNAFGERCWPLGTRIVGHPVGCHLPAIRKVPWVLIDGERRAIEAGRATSVDLAVDDDTADHLRALGYAGDPTEVVG